MNSSKINIAILDDHVGIREGYRTILSRIPYVFFVAPFGTSDELYEGMKKENFHLILIDIRLKDENGLDICKHLKNKHPDLKVLMISSFHNENYILNAHHNDADGYLFKDAELKEIRLAIDTIIQDNGCYYNLEGLQIIHNHERHIKEKNKTSRTRLTEIEIKVAKEVCDGKTTKEIAIILGLEPSTINTHRNRIWKKLDIHKVAELLNYMISNGLYIPKRN